MKERSGFVIAYLMRMIPVDLDADADDNEDEDEDDGAA